MSERKKTPWSRGWKSRRRGWRGPRGVAARNDCTRRTTERGTRAGASCINKGKGDGCSQRRQELLFGLGGSSGLGCRGDGCWRMWRVYVEASGFMWSVGLAQVRHALLARVVVSGRSLSKGTHPSAAPRLPSVSSLLSARLNQLPLTSLFLFCSSHTSLGRRTSRGSAR